MENFQLFHIGLLFLTLPADDHQRPWLHKQQSPTVDSSTICGRLFLLHHRRLYNGSVADAWRRSDPLLLRRHHRPDHA